MLNKLLNIAKKPTDFFLELNEEQSNPEEAKSSPDAVAETAVTESVTTESAPQKPASASASQGKKTKSKKKQNKTGQQATETIVTGTPQRAQVSDPVTQLIVNAVSAKKVSENKSEGIAQNFATDYLIAKPAPNRRPSVSMNKFKEMSRTMKNTTSKIKPKKAK